MAPQQVEVLEDLPALSTEMTGLSVLMNRLKVSLQSVLALQKLPADLTVEGVDVRAVLFNHVELQGLAGREVTPTVGTDEGLDINPRHDLLVLRLFGLQGVVKLKVLCHKRGAIVVNLLTERTSDQVRVLW